MTITRNTIPQCPIVVVVVGVISVCVTLRGEDTHVGTGGESNPSL